jgi:cell division protease FtsH
MLPNQNRTTDKGAMERDNKPQRKTFSKRNIVKICAGAALLAALVLLVTAILPQKAQPERISLSQAAAAIATESVLRLEDVAGAGEFTLYYKDGRVVTGIRDQGASLLEQLNLLGLTRNQLSKIEYEILKPPASLLGAQPGFPIILLLLGVPMLIFFYFRRREGFGKKSFNESVIPDICFDDVAGLNENLDELREIVSFLKEGNKFVDVGAKMPHGILMVGNPGTGKTLMARAIAGEAGVPFFATSGSEFVEMYVGVGAKRMRSLFEKARKKAPCIIFIDEIDAVGRARHSSQSGAEMEQDQTLNQLLVEMDGFDSSEGVVILAATNRLDVLDPALTRPGRFDRRVFIHPPDVKGRQAILSIHTKGKKLSPDVDLLTIARATPGLVGADLANIVNEAAISAVHRGYLEIYARDFDEAIEKVLAGGVQRKSQVISEDERQIVAYHEAGHAIVMHQTRLADPVHKITIIPRGQTGGYTMAIPNQDSMLVSKHKLMARITGLMGGRAAEELFFQDITSGASNDLNIATQLAEEMVMKLGMDHNAGLRVFTQFPGYSSLGTQSSQKTFETIDEAVNGILTSCYNDAKTILLEKRAYVEKLASDLLELETIDREQFLHLMGSEILVH